MYFLLQMLFMAAILDAILDLPEVQAQIKKMQVDSYSLDITLKVDTNIICISFRAPFSKISGSVASTKNRRQLS